LLTPNLHVLTFGSVYQGGFVFSIDDTTPNTANIGGKVVALSDQSSGDIWGGFGTDVDASNYENSSSGANDGAANTATIVDALGISTYAAELCVILNSNGYTDWYLPSICELSPFGVFVRPARQIFSNNCSSLPSTTLTSPTIAVGSRSLAPFQLRLVQFICYFGGEALN
jgi:hypothetical protein